MQPKKLKGLSLGSMLEKRIVGTIGHIHQKKNF
jgi:hypothetical protein